jgi:branched-chain amino acid transport system ATP-binding protein
MINRKVLSILNLELSFGSVKALRRVTMDVWAGEILAIIGPNGAGKTSLLNCINGFYKAQGGHIFLEEEEITNLQPHRIARKGIARTFQATQTYAALSVLQNVLVGRHVRMRSNVLASLIYWPWVHREEVEHRKVAEDIIDFLEMEAIRNQLVGTLGYGLRKRVDLGRALALEPRLLLLDEPMAGMNIEEKEDVARFIIDIRESQKIPIVFVEHDMEVVMDIADRIIVLDWGNKIAEGTPDEIRASAQVVKAYLGEEA